MSTSRISLSRHFHADGDAVARDAGLGAGDEAVVLEDAVDQRRLAGVGAADEGDADRLVRLGRRLGVGIERLFAFGLRLQRNHRAGALQLLLRSGERLVEIGHALAVLGGDRRRFAEAEPPGFEEAFIALLALALVGGEHDRLAGLAQQLREALVDRRHARRARHTGRWRHRPR